jgi:Undecaprenyl-phosphate glucose phosphotransferase
VLKVESELKLDTPLDSPVRSRERWRVQWRRLRFNSTWCEEAVITALAALDMACVVAAGFLSHTLFAPTGGTFREHCAISIVCGLVLIHFGARFKLYDLTLPRRPLEIAERTTMAAAAAFVLLALITYVLDDSFARMSAWKVSTFLLSIALISTARFFADKAIAKLGEYRILSRNVVIFGAGKQGKKLIEQLARSRRPWTRILCLFDDRARDPSRRMPRRIGRYPVLGTTDDLIAFSRRVRIDEIFIALPWTATERIQRLLGALRVIPANVHVCPELLYRSAADSCLSALDGLPVVTMSNKPVTGWGYLAKACLDKGTALLGLLLLSPLLLSVAAAIKFDSPGSPFFSQQRLGFNNKPFKVYKFRTLYQDQCDSQAEQIVTRQDPRVTRVGRFLRRTSIDELPQLINVLRGEMSLVGPRPHALKASAGGHLYAELVADYALRHRIKPGITGWAQINGWRGETDTTEKIVRRVEHDLYYINNWSILFDLHILILTVLSLPFQRNAY